MQSGNVQETIGDASNGEQISRQLNTLYEHTVIWLKWIKDWTISLQVRFVPTNHHIPDVMKTARGTCTHTHACDLCLKSWSEGLIWCTQSHHPSSFNEILWINMSAPGYVHKYLPYCSCTCHIVLTGSFWNTDIRIFIMHWEGYHARMDN